MRTTFRYFLPVAVTLAVSGPIAVAKAEGDPGAGAKAFEICGACHSLKPNVNMSGPSLAGIWGRKTGSLSSFPRYSPALAASDVVWNEQSLDAWLADPAGFHST